MRNTVTPVILQGHKGHCMMWCVRIIKPDVLNMLHSSGTPSTAFHGQLVLWGLGHSEDLDLTYPKFPC